MFFIIYELSLCILLEGLIGCVLIITLPSVTLTIGVEMLGISTLFSIA